MVVPDIALPTGYPFSTITFSIPPHSLIEAIASIVQGMPDVGKTCGD